MQFEKYLVCALNSAELQSAALLAFALGNDTKQSLCTDFPLAFRADSHNEKEPSQGQILISQCIASIFPIASKLHKNDYK